MTQLAPPLARLTSQHLMEPLAALRIFHQTLTRPSGLHWHEFYEVTAIVAGTGMHLLNGYASPLRAGSIFLLTPADFHNVIPDPQSALTCYNVIFTQELVHEEVAQMLCEHRQGYQAHGTPSLLIADFERLWTEAQVVRPGQRLVMRGTLERILIDVARACQSVETTGTSPLLPPAITEALLYLHQQFREPLTLGQVARVVHLSPTYLSERFHALVGVTFQKYLQTIRVQFAQGLLALPTGSMTEVGHAAGFISLSQFERAFKQQIGMTPQQYRQRPPSGSRLLERHPMH